MAITATLLTEGADTTDGTSYATVSVTLTANRLYLLFLGIGDAAAGGADEAPSSVTSTGATWVQIAFDQRGTSSQAHAVFRTMVASNQTGAITVTFTNAQDALTWHVVEVNGIDTSGTNGSGAVAEVVTGEGTSTGSIALTGVTSGNASLGGVQMNSSTTANFTGFGADWAQVGTTQGVGSPSISSAVGFDVDGLASMPVNFAGAQAWSGAVIELVLAPVVVEDWPTITLQAAFTTNPGATPSWTDISEYLREVTVNRGRQRELDRFAAGRSQFILANEDRRFDPTYAAGPYYPNVLPMRRVRLSATWASTTYVIFDGYADGWEQRYEPPQEAVCVLSATDAFKVLTQIELPASAYEVETRNDSPAAWWRLGEPSGSTSLLDSIGSVHLTVSGAPTLGGAGLTVRDPDTAMVVNNTTDAARSTRGVATGVPLSIEVIVKTTIAFSGYIAGQGEVGAYSGSGLSLSVLNTGFVRFAIQTMTGSRSMDSTVAVNNGSPHHIVGTWDAAGLMRLYIDGTESGASGTVTGTLGGTQIVQIGGGIIATAPTFAMAMTGTVDEVAMYGSALSAARVLAHSQARATAWSGETSGARVGRILDAIGWSASERNIDTGVSTLQGADLGGDALSALQKIEETEQGRLFVTNDGKIRFLSRLSILSSPYTVSQATFGDSGAELEYGDLAYVYDDQLIYNEARVSRADGTVQVARDTTSQAQFLRRVRVVDGLLHQTDATSIDLANWIVTHYKDPLLRATNVLLEPSAGNETTHYPHALGRELMERVTVRRRPQNYGSAIDQETHVEGIIHEVRGMIWNTRWNLSPADTQVYWLAGVVGHSEAGVTTRAGF